LKLELLILELILKLKLLFNPLLHNISKNKLTKIGQTE